MAGEPPASTDGAPAASRRSLVVRTLLVSGIAVALVLPTLRAARVDAAAIDAAERVQRIEEAILEVLGSEGWAPFDFAGEISVRAGTIEHRLARTHLAERLDPEIFVLEWGAIRVRPVGRQLQVWVVPDPVDGSGPTSFGRAALRTLGERIGSRWNGIADRYGFVVTARRPSL